jgi:gas vesicle protein
VIGALLVGAAIGCALGVLFTSDKGSELRKMIAGKTDFITKSLKEKFSVLMEEASREFEASKEKAQQLAQNGKLN